MPSHGRGPVPPTNNQKLTNIVLYLYGKNTEKSELSLGGRAWTRVEPPGGCMKHQTARGEASGVGRSADPRERAL